MFYTIIILCLYEYAVMTNVRCCTEIHMLMQCDDGKTPKKVKGSCAYLMRNNNSVNHACVCEGPCQL